jgi:hypothetical protein
MVDYKGNGPGTLKWLSLRENSKIPWLYFKGGLHRNVILKPVLQGQLQKL